MKVKHYPLSLPQKNILMAEQYYADTNVNNNCAIIKFKDADTVLIQKAVNLFICNTQAMRLVLDDMHKEPDQAAQHEQDYLSEEFQIRDMGERNSTYKRFIRKFFRTKLNPEKKMYAFMILTFSDGSAELLSILHHLIADGWGYAEAAKMIYRYYQDLRDGKEPKDRMFDYTPYLEKENEQLKGRKYQRDEQFFNEYLKTKFEPARLSMGSQSDSVAAKRFEKCLTAKEKKILQDLKTKSRQNLMPVMISLYAIYCAKIQSCDRIAFGSPCFNRENEKERKTMGAFVNMLPFVMDVNGNDIFSDLCESAAFTSLQLLRHQRFPYQEIQKIAKEKHDLTEKLYHIMFNFIPMEFEELDAVWMDNGTSQYELCINVTECYEGDIRIAYDYLPEICTEKEIKTIHQAIFLIAEQILEKPQISLEDISIISQKEKKQIEKFNSTEVEYDPRLTVGQMFEKFRQSEETAVVCQDTSISYRQLHLVSDQIARALRADGIGPNDVVALCMKRSVDFICAVFGVVKSGAAFLPMDLEWPKNRREYVLENSQAVYTITDNNFEKLKGLALDTQHEIPVEGKPDDLCYVIYTSGSTGKPKGVMLTQQNAVNFSQPLKYNYLVKEINDKCKTVLSMGNLAFDISISEYFPALLNGKTLILADEKMLSSIESMTEAIRKHQVDCLQCTPSRLLQYLENDNFASSMKQMKVIMAAAEVFPQTLSKKLSEISTAVLMNGYGPTETTMGASYSYVSGDKITIGKPISNVSMYIMNRYGNILPVGRVGELCIGGKGVGKGYLGLPEMTKEKFLNTREYGRIYRTGDFACLNSKGELEFYGRMDQQVKLRGLRIEISEIENVILSYPGISGAAVKIWGEGKDAWLCGYYEAENPLDEDALTSYLSDHLTYYMIPSMLYHMKEIPKSSAGKTDYKNLPAVEQTQEIISCGTETQEKLYSILKEVLHTEAFGIRTNLFQAGLTSLLVLKLNSMIMEAFGVELNSNELMRNPTILGIEGLLNSRKEAEEPQTAPVGAGNAQEYPLLGSQLGIWMESETKQDEYQYHIPVCFQLSSNIVPEKLQKAVKEALKCHPYLFSYFSKNGVQYPGQAVLKRRHVEDPLVTLEYREEPQNVEFVKPFYVTEPDLYRAGIYYNENEVCFYLDVHHILCDGQSMKILLRDIDRAYHGERLVQEKHDSFAYALEEAAKDQSVSQEISDYYDRLFKGAEQVSHLRADRNDPVHEALSLVLELKQQTVEEMQQFTRKHAVSLGNFYLSAVEVVLSRYTRTGDIILAAAESGRSFARYESTVGMLVKTLLLRQRIDASDTVTNLMQNVGQNLYENIAHDRIPYARLTGNYGLVPEIMFVYQNQNVEDLCFLEENAKMQSLVSQVNARAKFPVSFDISENKIRLEYDKGIYLRKSMQILLDAVWETIKAFLKNPQKKIEDIVIASETERQQICQFNHTEDSFPESETIVSAFERAAAEHKNETAVYGIDGELTFEELSKRSNRIANALAARGVKKEDIVIVQLKRTTDIICAMFGVLKAGAAYLPLDIENPAERVDYIKQDSNAAFHIQADNIGELLSETDDKYKDAKINGSNLCYCIYTSGSTGKPKGVLVEHGNVLNYALPLQYNHQIHTIVEECSVSVAVGNLAFDIAVAEIYPFLLCGKPVILASEEQISDARKLASVIRKYQADFILCTPTRLLQYLEEPLFAEVMADFKSVSAAGEAVSSEWVRRLREVTTARLYNGYGPTETTAGCTFKEIVSDEINIGSPISNVKAHILDTCLKPVPIQVPGELCITGRGVARGYLNQPELTRKAFIETEEGRMYRTGDIVYWTENGEIQYIGRGDGQIKLRGLRIELGEIEAAISDYPGIHSCAVLVNGTGNQALLCAYYTAESELDAASLKQELGLKLAEYMVPSVFVYLEQMPMNENGKIDTKLLQKIEIKQEKTACKTETQRQIFSILSEILGTEDFGITTDLYQLGMTSLSAMKINSRLTDLFLVELSSKDIMKHSTVEELEKLVLSAPGIEDGAGETQELYPLTKSQMGIYTEYDKDRNSVSYNMPTLLKFDKNINIDRLLQALETAVEAHPYLKSYIVKQDSDLYLRRNEEAGVAIGRKEIDGQEFEQKEVTSEIEIQGERLIRPFVLEKGPLYRLEVYEGPEAVYLFMDFHHILFDGLSNAVFLEDVKAAYEGHPVLPEIQDAFTFTQKELQEQAKEKAHTYFQNMFADVEEGSKVFFDYPDQGKNHAGYYIRKIPEEMLDKMNQFAAEQRVTPGSLLLSAFLFTVAKYGRNHRVAVGTVENGREKSGYQRSVGMFVRTIPLCVELNKEELAGQYIKRVHRTMLEVSQNASYTYTDFADEFGMNLDTHFVYNENLQTEMRLEDSEAEEIPVLLKDAKFALTFSVSGDICQIDYRSDLYEENTICKFTDSVLHCLDMFMTAEGTELEHLSLAKEEDLEAYRVLNDTDVENDHSMTMDQMFLNAVEKYSDRAAVVCGETDALTYRQLGEAAARIAAGLKKRGIGRGDIAAFCLPRGIGVIKAIFGIIRAGAAVLPVDIVWPQGRKDYVIENSGAKLLITEEVLAQLELEDEAEAPKLQVTSEDLSYVLYTSGSTGKPKGAMLIQRNLTNFLKPLEHNCLVREMYQHCQSILSISNITFDISICEIFPAIFYGRKLVFADEKAFDSPRILSEFAGRHKVDCIQGTPSRISQYMEEPEFTKCLRNVKVMLVAGEALNHALTDKIREYSDTMILNGYGPTETTLAASYQYVTEKKITIGKPVANAKMYVVDPWMNLQPQGCVGELCIGGCNVGIGYIKREDLTREKFVPNPFHPGTLYHSGDLARLTGDGEIDFLGRIDSQIKLHGLRIELDEIESVMSSHPLVTACAVKVAGTGKNAYLCGYYMAKEPLPVQVLRDYMGKHLTYYMLPTVMMQLDVMPISTAGKIDRQNLPEIEVSEEIVPCETALQEEILEIVSQVLGTQKIGITTDFFRLGMTSLLAVKINTGLYEKFGVELSSRDILKNHTVVQLESLILQRSEAEAKETEIEKAEEYPLTENQLGVYVETIKNPQDKRYHMPGLYRMDADVDRQKLVLACKKAVAAHSYMNTCVKETDHGPVFVRNDEFIPEIKVQYSEHPDKEYTLQSFELTKAPLYEFAIFYNEEMTCLYFDIHHIIFDGESLSIFMADIKRAYENESVTKEEYTAFDHVILEQKKKELKADEDRAYFLKMFSGAEKVSSVHQDQRKEYCPLKRVEGKISDSCQKRLKEYAVNTGVTASSIYLAAFALVISRLTRKDDVIFAAVEDGRADQRFKNSVGMFVRTLPLCIQIEDTKRLIMYRTCRNCFMRQCGMIPIPTRDFPQRQD